MANLLAETLVAIKSSGHTQKDIIFIGSEETGHQCTFKEFKVLADEEYDPSFGSAEVCTDLIIVFSDGSKMAIENPTPVVKIRSEVTPEEFEEKDRILTRLIRGD